MIVATVAGKVVRLETATDKSGNEYQRGAVRDSFWDPAKKAYDNGRFINFRFWGKGPLNDATVGDHVTLVGELTCQVYTPQSADASPKVNYDLLVKSCYKVESAKPVEKSGETPNLAEMDEDSIAAQLGLQ